MEGLSKYDTNSQERLMYFNYIKINFFSAQNKTKNHYIQNQRQHTKRNQDTYTHISIYNEYHFRITLRVYQCLPPRRGVEQENRG